MAIGHAVKVHRFNSVDFDFIRDFDKECDLLSYKGSKEDAAVEFSLSLAQGLVQRATLLLSIHKSFEEYSVSNTETGQSYELRSKASLPIQVRIDWRRRFPFVTSSELHAVFDLASKSGMKGLIPSIGSESLLGFKSELSPITTQFSDDSLSDSKRDLIVLPILDSGRVSNPEMILALSERDFGQLMPAYENVLFFATKSMAEVFQDEVEEFSNFVRFILPADLGCEVGFESIDSGLVDFVPDTIDKVEMGLGLNDTLTLSQVMACNAYASAGLRLGLGIDPEMILCSAKLDFLTRFEMGDYSEARSAAVNDYLDSWSPVSNIVHGARGYPVATEGFPYTGVVSLWPGQLFSRSMNSDYGADLVDLLPVRAWELMRASTSLQSIGCILFPHKFGLLAPIPAFSSLSEDDIDQLADAGYKFQCGGAVGLAGWGDYNTNKFTVSQTILKLMDMAESPITIEHWLSDSGPSEVLKSVGIWCSMTSSSVGAPILATFAYRHGIEAMIEAVSHESSWGFLLEVFGPEALLKYVDRIPAKARVDIVSSDFNI